MNLAQQIKQKAIELGFDLVAITDAAPINAQQTNLLKHWLNSGCAGRMSYMQRNFEKRINPAALLENAKSVICVALNYKPPSQASPGKARQSGFHNTSAPKARIASYAHYEDYHFFVKNHLRKLTDFISSVTAGDFNFKICVDSAPVAERALAERAGLGFIGKNHMLINPEFGPQILLGEIITDLELPTDRPIKNTCSACNKCISACPTAALKPDGQFDANKCISYLTIEYKGQIPRDLADKTGDKLFGCDECLSACPYQHNAPACKNKQFKFYSDRAELDLHYVVNLSKGEFERLFDNSAIKRIGLEQLKRNAQICLANPTG